jgi:hypothetical protein
VDTRPPAIPNHIIWPSLETVVYKMVWRHNISLTAMLTWICLSKNKQSHGYGSSAFLQIRDTFNTCLWYSVSPVSPTYFNIDYYLAFSYHISYQPSTHISLWAFCHWANMGRGLIWHVIWKFHIITYLSYTSMRFSSYLRDLIVFRNHVVWYTDIGYDAMSYYIYVFIICI